MRASELKHVKVRIRTAFYGFCLSGLDKNSLLAFVEKGLVKRILRHLDDGELVIWMMFLLTRSSKLEHRAYPSFLELSFPNAMAEFETWNLLIHAARASEARDPAFSETCLRKALRFSEDLYGKESPETGLCLIELSDFLRRKGEDAEAEELSLRYQGIMVRYTQPRAAQGQASSLS